MDGLLVVIIGKDLFQIPLNLQLLLLHHIVDDLLHPGEVGVHIAALLALHVLRPVQEVVLLLELGPQLLAPLGEDAQDGRVLNGHVHAGYFGLAVLAHVLGDLPADSIGSVALDSCSVFLLVCSLGELVLGGRRLPVHPLPRL